MYDLAIDPETGDLMFGPTHDLLGTTGPTLIDQRILIRAKIPRGSFSFDATGTLGSRLYQIQSAPGPRQLREAPAILQEALEPMDDIHIADITAEITDNNRLALHVSYGMVVFDDEGETVSTADPEFDADLTI